MYEATDANLRIRIQELDAMTRINHELNQPFQLDRILEVIRIEAQRTTGADAASVVLVKPPDQRDDPNRIEVNLRVGALAGVDELSPIEHAAFTKAELVSIPDYGIENVLEAFPSGAKSAVATPIKYNQYDHNVSGVLHLYSGEPDFFSDRTRDFLQALANQAMIAIKNAAFFEDVERLRQHAVQLILISELGLMLRSGDKIEKSLSTLAKGIIDIVGYRAVLISQLDRETAQWRYVAQVGYTTEAFQKKTPLTRTELDEKLQSPYQIGGTYFIPAGPATPDNHWQFGDVIYIPFQNTTGEILGLMEVDDPKDGKRPTPLIVEALEFFANQAAFIIENSRL